MSDIKIGRFHLLEGLCASRLESGNVLIEKFDPKIDCFLIDAKPDWSVEVKPEYFASFVAFVSARGENWDTWNEALTYHNKL